MKTNIKWKRIPATIFITIHWLLFISVFEIFSNMKNSLSWGWNINSVIFALLILVLSYTNRKDWKILKVIGVVVLLYIFHFLLTIPAAAVLGVLMYNPDHVRTIGEHRAILYISILPPLILAMWNSKLFSKKIL